jgi:hypothetical protein
VEFLTKIQKEMTVEHKKKPNEIPAAAPTDIDDAMQVEKGPEAILKGIF